MSQEKTYLLLLLSFVIFMGMGGILVWLNNRLSSNRPRGSDKRRRDDF